MKSKASQERKKQKEKIKYMNESYLFAYDRKNNKTSKNYSILYNSMLIHESWHKLKKSDIQIYITCRTFAETSYNKQILREHQENLLKNDIECDYLSKPCFFVFPLAVYKNIYKLNKTSVINSLKRLIKYGFIELVEDNSKNKALECNIYKFSDMWCMNPYNENENQK